MNPRSGQGLETGPGPGSASGTGEGNAGGGSTATFEAPRERPAAPMATEAPSREIAPATPAAASTGTDNKYVVWSSAPSDVPRPGGDDH
jgi:hypothetical protein